MSRSPSRWQARHHDASIDLSNGKHLVTARDGNGAVFEGSFSALRQAKASAELWIGDGKIEWLT